MDQAGEFAVYGPLGAMVTVLLTFSWWWIKRLAVDRDKAEQRARDLQEVIYKEIGPAMEAAASAIKARSEYEDEVRDVLVDVRRLLEGLQ